MKTLLGWSWRAAIVRLSAIAIGGLLALALVETAVAFGLVDFRLVLGTLGDEPWHNPMNRLDPELLHIHRPNEHFSGTMNAGDIAYYLDIRDTHQHAYEVVTDRHGFRNSADAAQADIVVLGDSYVEGINVPEGQTLSAELGRLLGKSSVNLGQIWYGPQQMLAVLKRYGLEYHPRICVWCFFEGNDLRDMKRYEEVAADWGERSRRFHSFQHRSLSRNLALRLLGLAGPGRTRPDGERNFGTLPSGEKMYFAYQGKELSADELASLETFRGIIEAAWSECKDHDVRLVFAYVPIKFRVYADICRFPEGSVCRSWRLNDLPERMQDFVGGVSSEIVYVDLTNGLRDAARAGEQTYLLDDTHWSAAGHRVSAEAIAAALAP